MAPLTAEVAKNRLEGVELEVTLPIVGTGSSSDVQLLLAQILSNHGFPSCARSYSRAPIPQGYNLSVEYDSSVQGERRYAGISWSQIEIKTRPMTFPKLANLLPPALEIIRYLGARVTPSCGFHVHHHLPDVVERPLIVRNLMHLWWRYQRVIYGLVAPSRVNNAYCRPPTQAEATHLDNCRTYQQLRQKLASCERQSGLNLTNLADSSRRTVEWRIHGGTLDWQKISAWVLATQRWVEHSIQRSCQYRPEPLPNTQASLNSLLVTTGLKPNSRIYPQVDKELRQVGRFLLKRWKHFNQGE